MCRCQLTAQAIYDNIARLGTSDILHKAACKYMMMLHVQDT
jgi:hypothetical protein